MSTSSPPPPEKSYGDAHFGNFVIRADCIFYRSSETFAFVNLRPIVPQHVLVASRRVVPRLQDLTDDEYVDLWRAVREVQGILQEAQHQQSRNGSSSDSSTSQSTTTATSFNVSVQDGRGAGQSVPHVHVHILPRVTGDFAQNDDIYQALEEWAPRPSTASTTTRLEVPDDDQRRDRTPQEMAEEAEIYARIWMKPDE